MSQLTRDYKGSGRPPLHPGGMKEFVFGVLAGALLAGGIAALVAAHARHRQARLSSACTAQAGAGKSAGHAAGSQPSAPAPRPQLAPRPQPASRGHTALPVHGEATAESGAPGRAAPAADHRAASPAPRYDFYQMLPKLTVPVPGPSAAALARGPIRPLRRSGPAGPPSYLVQAGSYTSAAQAQRLRKRLVRMGIGARIERVSEHGMTLNRVQVGPVDAAGLRWVRRELATAGIHPLVMPVRGK